MAIDDTSQSLGRLEGMLVGIKETQERREADNVQRHNENIGRLATMQTITEHNGAKIMTIEARVSGIEAFVQMAAPYIKRIERWRSFRHAIYVLGLSAVYGVIEFARISTDAIESYFHLWGHRP